MSFELKLYCDGCDLVVTTGIEDKDEYGEPDIPEGWFRVTNRNFMDMGVHYCRNCFPKKAPEKKLKPRPLPPPTKPSSNGE